MLKNKRSAYFIFPIWQGEFLKGNLYLRKNRQFKLIISYPLDKPVTFKISSGMYGLETIEIINKIVKCYKKIFKNPDKYGIWPGYRTIENLILRGLEYDELKNSITVVAEYKG